MGICGVVSYSVVRPTREIGIRTAFGALPPHLYRLVLRQGMRPAALGLVLRVAGAVALAACCVPARRAVRIDPMVALRYE